MMSAPLAFAVSIILAAGHHDPEVDDFKVVTLQHDADNVLAPMSWDVALHGGEHDLAGGSWRAVAGDAVGEVCAPFSSSMNGIR